MANPQPAQSSDRTPPAPVNEEGPASQSPPVATESTRSSATYQHAHENANTNRSTSPLNVPPDTVRPANRNPPSEVAPLQHRWDWEKFRWVVSPSYHELPLDARISNVRTERFYSYRKQRWRLLRLTIGEWLITVILCVAIFGQLYGYSKWDTFNAEQKRVFNALATALSVALGINLASSLRSYAKLLRWRLLAGRYRNLHQFELLLGAERQTNVIKLLWSEFFRKTRRYRFLPSGTQLLCTLWLMINLAATILVAMLGLTYNLDQSSSWVLLQIGNTSVVDFSYLDLVSYEQGLFLANFWGFSGFTDYLPSQSLGRLANIPDGYETTGHGLSRYWEIDYNPTDSEQSSQTDRYVDVQAYCQAYDVVEGQEGQLPYLIYENRGHRVNVTIYKENMPGPGGILYMSNKRSDCGSRCVNITVFQAMSAAGDEETAINKAQYYTCTNTVSQVHNIPYWNPQPYTMTDQQAQMLAGAIGWSGTRTPGESREFQSYTEDSEIVQFFYTTSASAQEMANLVSGYAAAAVAVADDVNSPARQYVEGDEPEKADYLHVHWWHAGPLLVLIPSLHFLSMIAVIAWANRAIIKDDTFLSVAKLYGPLIQRLGDHGCIMRGDQIVQKLHDPVVAYSFVDVTRDLKHVGLFEKDSGVKLARAFDEGNYDGVGSEVARRPPKLKVD